MALSPPFIILLLCSCIAATRLSGRPVKAQLDHAFGQFMKVNDFASGQLGVMQGSRLIYAEASGSGSTNKAPSASDLFPVLDLTKTVTSVAILQLIEQGYITLDTKIFGYEGVLYYLEPDSTDAVDPRIYDVTIEHLLRHEGGWDESEAEIKDPMKNQALKGQRSGVKDIAAELGREDGDLDQYDILQFMLSQPLQFAPGSRQVHSNFGYSILGRVVESIMGETYESYIKDNILEPAGMWHSKIGSPRDNKDRQRVVLRSKGGKVFDSESFIDPQVLDSTLGLYSNVYDMARFFAALYRESGNPLLKRSATLAYALQRSPEIARHHGNNNNNAWSGLGLEIDQDGALTIESSDDNGSLGGVSVLYYREAVTDATGDEEIDMYLRDSNTAIIFIGSSNVNTNKVSTTPKRMRNLPASLLALNLNSVQHNAYIRDLCDIELATGSSQVLTKHRLDEHRLVAYSNAMRLAGYYPTWLHSYNYNGHTYFMSIFELATENIQLQFKLKKASSIAKMYRFISNNVKEGYQVSLVQTFRSTAHSNHLVYFALLRRTSEPVVTMFNFNANLRTYQTELPYHMAEGYQQQVQGVLRSEEGPATISFVLAKPGPCSQAVETQAFTNVTLQELRRKQSRLGDQGYSLTYIDTFVDSGEHRFSVIFKQNELDSQVQLDVTGDTFISEAFDKTNDGYLPNLAVAYQKDGQLRYVVQWVRRDN